MKHVKVFEEQFVKLNMMKFEGLRAFKVDKDEGKLYRTHETYGEYFLTYDEYMKLEGLSETISQKIKLLEEQKKTTVDILRVAINKVIHDRPLNDTIKKYNL